jgi:hypothetical protein
MSTNGKHDPITGASWERLRSAMCYLDSRGYSYTSGTTVFAWNFAHLPEIASELLKHNVYMHNFAIMNAKYEWAHGHKSASVQARYSDLYPYLSQAIDILESHRIAVNVRYAPLCTMQGYERNLVGAVGVRYDPYEWMNKAGHQGSDPEFCAAPLEIHPSGVDAGWVYNESASLRAPVIAHRGDKVYPAACRACKARSACDGVDPRYLEHHGSGELRPYHESTLHGPVPLARRAYMPAFRVKMSQWTDMKAVMRQAFEHIGTSASSTSAVGIVAAGNRRLDFSSQTLHPQAVRFCQSGRVALHLMTEDCDVWIRVGSDVIEVPLDFAETFARAFAKWPGVDIIYADCQDLDAAGTVSHRSTPLVRARHLLGLPALSVLAFREKAASRLQANWLYKTVRSDASLFLVARTLGLNTRHLAIPMAVAARSPRLPVAARRIGNDR